MNVCKHASRRERTVEDGGRRVKKKAKVLLCELEAIAGSKQSGLDKSVQKLHVAEIVV